MPVVKSRRDSLAPLSPVPDEFRNTYRTLGQFLADVRATSIAGCDPDRLNRLNAAAGLNTEVASEGGALVPPDFATTLWNRTYQTGEILRRCSDFGRPRGSYYHIPQVVESSRVNDSRFGGVSAAWMQEGASISDSMPKFGLQTLKTKKIAAMCYLTDEQLEDAATTSDALETVIAMEVSHRFEDAIVTGTGAGRPLGLLNSACKIAVTPETNQDAGTVWGPNIAKMVARLWGPSWRTAVWLYNQELLDYLTAANLEGRWGSAGTSADGTDRLWNWDGNPSSGGWPTLCGRPAIPCEHCSAPGTEGDLILVDLSQYAIVAKSRAALSLHVRFLTDEGTFRFVLRCDGQPLWSSALTPQNGTDTLSPIITLASRA